MLIIGMFVKTMPENDKKLLEEWKTSSTMTYEELKNKLEQNHNLR